LEEGEEMYSLYMGDGCKIFEDEELKDDEIVGGKMLYLGICPPSKQKGKKFIFIICQF
jgi:hypothetical protein